jgi:hypothetical protein
MKLLSELSLFTEGSGSLKENGHVVSSFGVIRRSSSLVHSPMVKNFTTNGISLSILLPSNLFFQVL